VNQLVSSSERALNRWEKLCQVSLVLTQDDPGAMMNEIGLAQRRLLDDDPSTAGLQLPSTGTLYSTESVQSAPFPTIPSTQSYQMGPPDGNSFSYTVAPNETHFDGNPSMLPNRMGIYDLPLPNATNTMSSFPTSVPTQPFMEHQHADLNPPQETLQPIPQQISSYSPHDTEPISSVASLRMSGPKSDTAGISLISPDQSQISAQDELALPAAAPIAQPTVIAEPTTAKKKRGRPKKQPLPDNDEDDELANSRDHEFKTPGANGAIDPSDSEYSTENDTPASSGVSDETDEINLETVSNPGKSDVKAVKKKKTKKAQTTPAPNPVSGEGDVIWIDTKPREVESVSENTNPTTEQDIPKTDAVDSNHTPQPPQPLEPITTNKEKPKSTDEKPAPKKRGRKRKQPAEQEEPPIENADTEPTTAQTPGPKLAVVVDNSPKSAAQSNNRTELPAQEQSSETPASALDPVDDPLPPTTPAPDTPRTPSKTDPALVSTPQNGKGPNKHSPISARGGVPYRVGLSKRARIAPLLKMVRK
jgi:hypothetical protein